MKNIDGGAATVWRRTTGSYSKIKVAAGAGLISTAADASGLETPPKRVSLRCLEVRTEWEP